MSQEFSSESKNNTPETVSFDEVILLHLSGDLVGAEKGYRSLILREQKNHCIYGNLAIICFMTERRDEGIELLKKAIEIEPNYPEAYNNLGIAFQQQGKLEDAILAYYKALEIKPNYPEAYYNLGNTLQEQGKIEDAILSYYKALEIKSDYTGVYLSLGNAFQEQEKLEDAILAYHKALEFNPNFPEVYLNLGTVFQEQGKLEDAIFYYCKALEFNPDYGEVYINLGTIFQEQGKTEDAIFSYCKAIKLNPNSADAHMNLSTSLLLIGDFENGWSEYEYRLEIKESTIKINSPKNLEKWDENLNYQGELILVTEQGIGDAFHFIRYTQILKEMGLQVSIQCDKKLEKLFSYLSSIHQVYTHNHTYKGDNCQWYPLMSIPKVLGTDLENIPCNVPYLHIPEERVNYWKDKLISNNSNNNNFRIGIAWQGNPHAEKQNLKGRSFKLENLKILANISGIEVISFQKEFGSEQLEECDFRDIFVQCQLVITETMEFMDNAALMMNCDLIITSDTSVAHLAGALGRPTWLALKKVPEWRWMLERKDSLWYPTMRLFRQKENGDWMGVFEEIRNELLILLETEKNNKLRQSNEASVKRKRLFIPVSIGELLDKITILEIKKSKILETIKHQNIINELQSLQEVFDSLKIDNIENEITALRQVNLELWEIEDEIRECELNGNFGEEFIQLARSVYIKNDLRASIKREINRRLDSDIVEEKSYRG